MSGFQAYWVARPGKIYKFHTLRGGVNVGSFEYVRKLGVPGAYGEVCLVMAENGNEYALKVYTRANIVEGDKTWPMLKTEAEIKIDDPHFISSVAWGTITEPGPAERYGVLFPYVEGMTLTKYLEENPDLNQKERLVIAREIVEGMHAMHEEGDYLHNDLKPDNIMISSTRSRSRLASRNQVTIIDLQLSCPRGKAKEIYSADTRRGVGTFGYQSPEVLRGGAVNATIASDYWALATVIFEILVGKDFYECIGVDNDKASKELFFDDCKSDMSQTRLNERLIELYSLPAGIAALLSMMLTPRISTRIQISLPLLSEMCEFPNTSVLLLSAETGHNISRTMSRLFEGDSRIGEEILIASKLWPNPIYFGDREYTHCSLIWKDKNYTALDDRIRIHPHYDGRGSVIPISSSTKVVFCEQYDDRDELGLLPYLPTPPDFEDYMETIEPSVEELSVVETLDHPTIPNPYYAEESAVVGHLLDTVELLRVRITPPVGMTQIIMLKKGTRVAVRSSFLSYRSFANTKLMDLDFRGTVIQGFGRDYVTYEGEHLWGQVLDGPNVTVIIDGEPVLLSFEPL
ncbi:protein kinase [Candidatus Poseidoniales archaeon]|nr:protein kinase [Candidatus Poseidoniales archaeon]